MNRNLSSNYLKYFLVFFLFFLTNKISAQEPKEVITKSITDTSLKTRGSIKPEDTHFRLDYDDVYEEDTHAKFLQSKGFHGGGPSWLGILFGAFSLCENDLIKNTDSDVSVTGVSFWSDNKEDLEIISRVIEAIKSDEKILLEVIEIAKQHDMML